MEFLYNSKKKKTILDLTFCEFFVFCSVFYKNMFLNSFYILTGQPKFINDSSCYYLDLSQFSFEAQRISTHKYSIDIFIDEEYNVP